MIEITCYRKPLYVLEGLNLLSMLANGQRIDHHRSDVFNRTVADAIAAELNEVKQKIKIEPLDLFKYFDHTQASLATCLFHSFADGFTMEETDFLEVLCTRIQNFKTRKVESITIHQHLDIDDSSERNDPVTELLNLKIDDQDKIRLLKAIHDPRSYAEQILCQIRSIIPYIEAIFAKYQANLDLTYFNHEHTSQLLQEINCNLEGEVVIIPSVVYFNSLMLDLDEKGASRSRISCGIAMDVNRLNKVHFFKEDMEARLENFIKVINDKSKLKIIALLKEREMYGVQLAQELHLKTPTISYHIDALMNAGIVSARRVNNRIHYRYNKENCLQIVEYLKNKLS